MIVMTTNHERRLMTRLPNYRPVPVRSSEFLQIMFMRTMVANMVANMVVMVVMAISAVMVANPVVMVMVMVSFFGWCSLGPL